MSHKVWVVGLLPLLLTACFTKSRPTYTPFLLKFSGKGTIQKCEPQVKFGIVSGEGDGSNPLRFTAEVALDPSKQAPIDSDPKGNGPKVYMLNSEFIKALEAEIKTQIQANGLTLLPYQHQGNRTGLWGFTLRYRAVSSDGTVDAWLIQSDDKPYNYKIIVAITE